MSKNILLLIVFLLVLTRPNICLADDQAEPTAETRMRQALRDTMLQMQETQNQVVTLQATQAQSDKDKADLQAKLDAMTAQLKTVTDQAATDKAASDDTITTLKAQVLDQTGQIGRLNDGLKQWKAAYGQVSDLATAKEAARAQLEMQAALLQRTVDDRQNQNLALYQLGNEILTRYEKFSLGDALEAKEPFAGLTRVKLENLVQDYKYKLLDHAVTTGQPMAPVPNPSPEKKQDKTTTSSSAKPANPT